METIQSWVSKHKLTTVGGLWASGIGATLALTLAVLSGAAVYRYYENRVVEPKQQAENIHAPSLVQMDEWELLSPY
ncbi:hypothetical protein RYX36_006118 [Vicia faba]